VTAAIPRLDEAPEASRAPTLLWLAWRFLPPLDRADWRMFACVAAGCGYLAIPLTVALAAAPSTGLTLLSLLCLAAPGLPVLWCGAVALGRRRRETALALRQARIHSRAAGLTSLSKPLTYPTVGAILGTLLICLTHRPLSRALPHGAPLYAAVRVPWSRWLPAAPATVLLLLVLTALLGSRRAAVMQAAIGRLTARIGRRRAATPQPE
jgi:hypothetical protein